MFEQPQVVARGAYGLPVLLFLALIPAFGQQNPPVPDVESDGNRRAATGREPYDVGVLGGTLVDGTGAAARPANLYVHDGRIAAITPPDDRRRAATEIDARGLIVAPGFIDTHAHGDPHRTPDFGNFLSMGVTTMCLGQDGDSPSDWSEWLRRSGNLECGPNIAMFAGHGTGRNAVGIGNDPLPSPSQLEALVSWVRQAMDAGCFGLTTGLEYQPGSFAALEELVAVARPVAAAGGILMSHLRSEDDEAIEQALDELLEQGKRSGCAVHVSHIKVTYGHGAARAEQILSRLAEARQGGQRVTADIYPYLASFTGIGIVFPDWAKPPYDYQEVVRTRRAELAHYLRQRVQLRNGPEATLLATPPWTGKTLAQVSAEQQRPFEDLLIDEMPPHSEVRAAYFVMDAELQERLLVDPAVMVCSDGSPSMRHPRGFGAFARVIREYVVERSLLSLEEAVAKMTGLPAATTGLDRLGRGRLQTGFAADILVFNPHEVRDRATFDNPFQLASGFRWVLVNGRIASREGQATGERAGRVLRCLPAPGGLPNRKGL